MAIEEPKYRVVTKGDYFEIRKHPAFLVAETQVDSDFRSAGNTGFRILAAYIFGNNKSKAKLATMPSHLTLENIPDPNGTRIHIREIPPHARAVYSYSGSWAESRYQQKLADFPERLSKNGIKTEGEPVFARFNSPFALWFLRLNEIWLTVFH